MYKKYFFVILILFSGIALNFFQNNKSIQKSPVATTQVSPAAIPNSTYNSVLGQQTKTSGCIVRDGLPDKDCTPGAIIPTATKEQICVRGYTKTVRDVPLDLKKKVYEEYGVTYRYKGEYEVDHFISLELGGSNDISNLWPEPALPRPGFHEKDLVENYLHSEVCSGRMSLQEAQKEISADWVKVYNRMPK